VYTEDEIYIRSLAESFGWSFTGRRYHCWSGSVIYSLVKDAAMYFDSSQTEARIWTNERICFYTPLRQSYLGRVCLDKTALAPVDTVEGPLWRSPGILWTNQQPCWHQRLGGRRGFCATGHVHCVPELWFHRTDVLLPTIGLYSDGICL
jgi:hypothetical protein